MKISQMEASLLTQSERCGVENKSWSESIVHVLREVSRFWPRVAVQDVRASTPEVFDHRANLLDRLAAGNGSGFAEFQNGEELRASPRLAPARRRSLQLPLP